MPGATAYAKGTTRRTEILDATVSLLARGGMRGASVKRIATEIGITPSHLNYYFGGRERLLEAVIEAWDTPDFPVPDRTVTFLEHWIVGVRHNATVPGLIHLYTAFAAESAPSEHTSHEFFRRRFAHVRAQVANDLRHRRQVGVVRADIDPEVTAQVLIAYSDGLQLEWLFDPSIDMPRRLIEVIDALGVNGRPVLDHSIVAKFLTDDSPSPAPKTSA